MFKLFPPGTSRCSSVCFNHCVRRFVECFSLYIRPCYIPRHLSMAPTGIDMDVEAQIDSVTATPNQPQGASIPNLAPPANTANPQLPTGTDSQPQATNTNQHHIESAPVTETGGNSQAQRGRFKVRFPVSLVVISFAYQTRTAETLLMGSGLCTSLRLRSKTRR